MLRNNCYSLKELSGVHYLLPVGQMIADHKRGIRINDTGVFIWEALKEDLSAEDLILRCAEQFQLRGTDMERLRADIRSYLSQLYAMGIVTDSTKELSPSGEGAALCIAGLKLRLYGPKECFGEAFDAFSCDASLWADGEADQTVAVQPCPPLIRENGRMLLRSSELEILELADKYIVLFPNKPQITEAHLSKDGKIFRLHCLPPFDEAFRNELFHAIRLGFLYLAQRNGMAVLHSASVLYRGRAWLFSGPSGTGKSTHAALWQTQYQTPLINGDLNLIAMQGDTPMIYGIPWCGTSGICDPSDYRLGGVILLKQAQEDETEELTEDKRRLLISQRLISPFWNEEMLTENLSLTDRIADRILICRLRCTKEKNAADVMKAKIDAYLSEHEA